MKLKKRLNKKLIILALLLVLMISIGVVSAANNDTDVKSTSDEQIELSTNDDICLSSSNETALGANVDFTGSTFTELEQAINGAHEGDTIILNNDIVNDRSREIRINISSLTIEGNGHTIDALGKSGIFYIKSNDVILNNITFTNAKNAYISGDDMYGGAIHWHGNNGVLNNSVFTNNVADYYYYNPSEEGKSGYGGAIDWVD